MIQSKSYQRYQRLLHILLTVITLIMVLPILLLFMASVTDEKVLIAQGYSYFPSKFGLEGYSYIMSNASTIFRSYGLTLLVTAVGTVVSLVITMLMAFPLSIRRLPGRTFFFLFCPVHNAVQWRLSALLYYVDRLV